MHFGIFKLPAADIFVIALPVFPALGKHRPLAGTSTSLPLLRTGQALEFLVYFYDFSFFPLEISVGLEVIEHCRDKVLPIAPPADLTAVAGKIRKGRMKRGE